MGGGTYGGFANGTGRVFDLAEADTSCSFDYDGVGSIGTEGRLGVRSGATTGASSLATAAASGATMVGGSWQ